MEAIYSSEVESRRRNICSSVSKTLVFLVFGLKADVIPPILKVDEPCLFKKKKKENYGREGRNSQNSIFFLTTRPKNPLPTQSAGESADRQAQQAQHAASVVFVTRTYQRPQVVFTIPKMTQRRFYPLVKAALESTLWCKRVTHRP